MSRTPDDAEVLRALRRLGGPCTLAGDTAGLIASVSIRAPGIVAYEAVWWDGRFRHSAFVLEAELQFPDEEKKT